MISVIVRNIVSSRGSVLSLWKAKHFLHFVFSNLAAFTYFSIKQKTPLSQTWIPFKGHSMKIEKPIVKRNEHLIIRHLLQGYAQCVFQTISMPWPQKTISMSCPQSINS